MRVDLRLQQVKLGLLTLQLLLIHLGNETFEPGGHLLEGKMQLANLIIPQMFFCTMIEIPPFQAADHPD
ncbi:hypothetical protein D3C75_595970 [compost metagenome]